jgi:hypothetical protein
MPLTIIYLTKKLIFSGLQHKEMNLLSNGEIDFLIVSLQTKSIIQIEAKKGNSQKNIKAAAVQLEKGFEFFNENFPFPSSENWSYIKVRPNLT